MYSIIPFLLPLFAFVKLAPKTAFFFAPLSSSDLHYCTFSLSSQIDVALRFYGNSSLSYFIPAVTDEESTSISLVFRPEETDGLMLYTEAGLGLQLTNGSVQFEFDLGSGATVVSTPDGLVQPDEWYQLFATR